MGRILQGIIASSCSKGVLGLSTTYATAEINANYAYYNALINSHASGFQTALASEQSLIASEIACYRAFSGAARAEVVAELGARSTFNTAIMTALDTANASYRSAVGASDLSAARERVAFVSCEAIAEPRRVYNIEVEGAHTYFVGDGGGVLAHNKYYKCGDSGFYWISTGYYPTRINCPLCANLKDYSEPKESIKESNVKRLMDEYCLSQQQVMELLSATTLAEYMKAFYNASDEQFEKFKRATTEKSNQSHYEKRFNHNKMHEFFELDWEQLSNPRWKAQVEKGDVVTCEFLGSRWRLLENWRSREHERANKRAIDIDDFNVDTPLYGYGYTYAYECYKWCSDSGRELVIQAKYEVKYINGRPSKKRVATFLEIDPDKFGAYNYYDPYILLGVPHCYEDYVPYMILRNIPHINK